MTTMPEGRLVYDPRRRQAHHLDPALAAVLDGCDGMTALSQAAARLGLSDEQLLASLESLYRAGLVSHGAQRRLALKLGLAALTTVAVPAPAAALSVCAHTEGTGTACAATLGSPITTCEGCQTSGASPCSNTCMSARCATSLTVTKGPPHHVATDGDCGSDLQTPMAGAQIVCSADLAGTQTQTDCGNSRSFVVNRLETVFFGLDDNQADSLDCPTIPDPSNPGDCLRDAGGECYQDPKYFCCSNC
ncbi:MAG: hypothetical protein KC910_25350 [Candidatus Eremiobacteraeota bacterium]|nr:hypothetical protein [Candidatus Eremiobacteraeota bacterium]